MENRQKVILTVGGVLILCAGVVAYTAPVIKAQAKAHNEIELPAERLAEAVSGAPNLMDGIVEIPGGTEPSSDPILHFGFTQSQVDKELGRTVQQTAKSIARDPKFRKEIWQVAMSPLPETYEVETKDVLWDRSTRASRSIARAIVDVGLEHQKAGHLKDALTDYRDATEFSQSFAKAGESSAVVANFAIENIITRNLYDLVLSPKVTVAQLDQITAFVDSLPTPITVDEAFRRTIQECIVATRNIDSYTEENLVVLNCENRNPGPPAKHPKIKEAMETRLIDLYTNAESTAASAPTNDMRGVIFDQVIRKQCEDRSDGNYMVRTLGTIFEQLGRNLTRVVQARQALKCLAYIRKEQIQTGAIPQSLPANLTEAQYGQDHVTMEYQPSKSGCVIVSHSLAPESVPLLQTGFQIDQQAGVYLYYNL